MDFGIVEYFSGNESHKCGYCGNESSRSHGMWAHKLTNQNYQDLIDRGWRRSGEYCYKPTMKTTCCPQYTIRCKANDFKLYKSHKKVIKKFNRYLNSGIPETLPSAEGNNDDGRSDAMMGLEHTEVSDIDSPVAVLSEPRSPLGESTLEAGRTAPADDPSPVTAALPDQTHSKPETQAPPTHKAVKPGLGADPSKSPCKKAKLMRLERRQQRLAEGKPVKTRPPITEKSLEDFLHETVDTPKHTLDMRLVRSSPPSEEFERTFATSYALYKKYQIAVHHDLPSDCPEKQFRRFLCNSPLERETQEGQELGSFHHQYWLDGRLVAVGVIDILPACTSSVYLYYDPDYGFLSLGTYSALRELQLTRQISQLSGSIEWYYMGYYIHSCPKMKYKGNYEPSYLGCPETYKFVRIEECRPKLDAAKFARFSAADVADDDRPEISSVMILFKRQAMSYDMYRILQPHVAAEASAEDVEEEENEIKEFAELVGRRAAERILLYRSASR